jgi:hypothetical protein
MIQHYILNINPNAECDWDRLVLRNPITGERPDLTNAIAQAVGNEPGSYLISINIDVQVLEKAPIQPSMLNTLELPANRKTTLPSPKRWAS